jgi:CpeT/CpcT family (DUF1001)
MADMRAWLIVVASGILCACATPGQRRDTDLKELTVMLPGTYDNIAQALMDERQGVRPAHDRLTLAIVPIQAPTVGEHVFYMQEMAADDPRRVMAQRVFTFDATQLGIVQTQWALKEPLRWRDGHINPEVFEGLVPQDLRVLRGCSIVWKKAAERFVGATTPGRCHENPSPEYGLVQTEIRQELGPDELSISEVGTDATGRLVRGRPDEPFDRFRKETR